MKDNGSLSKRRHDVETERAISWITDRVRHLSQSSGVGVLLIEWKTQENIFVMQMEGRGGKRASKFFEKSDLAQCPLQGEQQAAFDAQLLRLMQFFKAR